MGQRANFPSFQELGGDPCARLVWLIGECAKDDSGTG